MVDISSDDPAGWKPLRGLGGAALPLEGGELLKGDRDSRFRIWTHGGSPWLVRVTTPEFAGMPVTEGVKQVALLWRVSSDAWISGISHLYQRMKLYLSTRRGQLLYSSFTGLSTDNLNDRILVQEFTRAPLSRAQLELKEGGEAIHGVFQEVTGTNLVIFLEMPVAVTMLPVTSLAWSFMMWFGGLLVLTFVAFQFPLRRLVAPIKALVRHAEKIGEGSYELEIAKGGPGEIRILNAAFQQMADSLVEKDKAITQYIEEQKEAVRLQGELATAHTIQENLMPDGVPPKSCGIDLAVTYVPAEECAGDWYTWTMEEESGDFIFAVADVSGHGTGSAMFTAMIAAAFEDAVRDGIAAFDCESFLDRTSRTIMKLGRSEWHSTFCLIRHRRGNPELEIYGAGALPVLQLLPGETGKMAANYITMNSDLLGVTESGKFRKETATAAPGSTYILYTDGMTEALSEKKRQYGVRRLKKTARTHGALPAKRLLDRLVKDWKDHCAPGQPQEDDFCLMVIKIAS